MDKLQKQPGIPVCVLLFSVLLLLGVWIGSLFVQLSDEPVAQDQTAVFLNGMFRDVSAGYLRVFSAFLFDFLFYLLLVFLFGMTFLGIGVIPAVVFFRGFTLGASLSALLVTEGMGAYFQGWMTYLPAAAFCTLVFLLFSERAFGVSLRSAGLLFKKVSGAVSVKNCGVQFLFALLLLLFAAAVRCGCVFLAAIFI